MITIEEQERDYKIHCAAVDAANDELSHLDELMFEVNSKADYYNGFIRGFKNGAKHEREILTRWHDPKKELPDTTRDVLIKTTLCAKYQVAFYKASSSTNYRWHENNGAIDNDMVIGWREIPE